MDVDEVTVLTERRRDGNAIGWVLIVAFGVAAWRGAEQEPVLAALMGALTAWALGGWVLWRFHASRQLTIAAEEITYGRPGHVITRIPRSAGPLRFRRRLAVRLQTVCFLEPRRESGAPGVAMLGFDVAEVRRACVGRGWEFGH